ncbi:glucose-6-phosphate dehydrogenase [Sodalis-like secondary symbiont of Drepanosiphum platanoidis]|uniref:glucose-6-phosphate dehydrogenase n=1 Tax=Sodalis-like secondary symbiont of Drepanosiphum platanoidis TaxID=2994493 RepID=UPI003463C26B
MSKIFCYVQACDLIILGAKGDLSRRKLFPALYNLEKKKILHPNTKIISVGRANWSIKFYKNIVYKELKCFIKEKINKKLWKKFSSRLNFYNLDINETENFYKLKKKLNQKKRITISYCAISSNNFLSIFNGLKKSKINNKSSRIILEKPIGNDFKSSKKINKNLSKFFKEKQIYRIDHYLGKETIINLLTLRFANSLFINNWNNQYIDYVQITVAENIGIEGRWEYFDKVGQMRDMIQSHLLQILTIITMSAPTSLTYNNIRDEKIKILRSLRKINYKNVDNKTVIGQYTSGYINGKKVPGYLEEKKSIKNSFTETFVSIKVNIDNWQWKGVPFYLRTGKRLPVKYSEIVIFFKDLSLNIFKDSCNILPKNKLIIRLDPNDKIDIEILNKNPKSYNIYALKKRKININLKTKQFYKKNPKIDAYERLILELMKGKKDLFVSNDEIEESWKWIDSIIIAWKLKNKRPSLYNAGTWGPKDSEVMINRDGKFWKNF